MGSYNSYIAELIHQFWDYADANSLGEKGLLDLDKRDLRRPPVFQKQCADQNILVSPDADAESRDAILATLPTKERHRHFASMRSSQALAQSVFGNLAVYGKPGCLEGLYSDEGLPAFAIDLQQASIELEYNVSHLGEPRPTSVDVWFNGACRVAVECKLTEPDFGTCSRPKMKQGVDANYDRDYCDGTYTRQRNRRDRCSLTEIGVKYWAYIPEILRWRNDEDMSPCELRSAYQLIRNVLAACVDVNGVIDAKHSYALVVYDANNPAFQEGGLAKEQLAAAKAALRAPEMLRSVSWQSLVTHLESCKGLDWLIGQLRAKYGMQANK